MQGLADGYFVLPYTIGDYLATAKLEKIGTDHPAVEAGVTRRRQFLETKGKRTVASFHRELGKLVGRMRMARRRNRPEACTKRIPELREEFWKNVNVLGSGDDSWKMPDELRTSWSLES